MKVRSFSLDDAIDLDALRRAQSPLHEVAHELGIPEISPDVDLRAALREATDDIITTTAVLRQEDDGIVTLVSASVSQNHYDPYQMVVFAANEIEAARLRAELSAWLDQASQDLKVPRQELIRNGRKFVAWYELLARTQPEELADISTKCYLSSLVTKFYHPHSDAAVRRGILQKVHGLSQAGLGAARAILRLLTAPSDPVIDATTSSGSRHPVGDGDLFLPSYQLADAPYEVEYDRLTSPVFPRTSYSSRVARAIQQRKLKSQPIRILIAGGLEEIYSIYALHTLLADGLRDVGILHTSVDTGISNTLFHVARTAPFVKTVRRWFDAEKRNVRELPQMIRAFARNELPDYGRRLNPRSQGPTDEELVLFYLRTLSPAWNGAFISKIETGRSTRLKRYAEMKQTMEDLIPADWRSAMDAYWRFLDFIRQALPAYAAGVRTLQPINLATDSQIAQATLVLSVSQHSLKRLLRRFPAGTSNKAIFFGDLDPESSGSFQSVVPSPYGAGRMLSSPSWDVRKEEAIRKVITRSLLPVLKQEVSVDRIKLVKLLEVKHESTAAMRATSDYVAHLQKLAWYGNDTALVEGLIFLLAVKEDIDPSSADWARLLARYETDREALQDRVFEGKRRVLPDFVAIQFLRNYVGEKKYVNKAFPDLYQRYNEAAATFLIKAVAVPRA